MQPVVGAQTPRIRAVPEYDTTAGDEAIEVARLAGLNLDPWEDLALLDGCGMTFGADGAARWASFQVGVDAPRQNGKGSILEARELAGTFAFGERLVIHSAHEQATATEHFMRLLTLIEGVPEFDQRVLKVVRGKGMEAIQLRGGYRILFKTRTGGGGRGFTGDLVVLDEAMILPDTFMGALVPTMAARSITGNPQLWLTGSAVDRLNPKHDGKVFSRLRRNALAGQARTAWLEWSIEGDDPDAVSTETRSSPEAWAQANPGLGIRISSEYIEAEMGALAAREFAVERLGVGDWEVERGDGDPDGISKEMWLSCQDPTSAAVDPVCFMFDVSPNRSTATISVAGLRADGLPHVEVVDHRPGTEWIVDRLVELAGRHECCAVPYDNSSPAASLVPDLQDAGVNLRKMTSTDMAQACGRFFDAVQQQRLRHRGSVELQAAVLSAARRPLGDAWAWARKTSTGDITPLVACTGALWGLTGSRPSEPMVAWR